MKKLLATVSLCTLLIMVLINGCIPDEKELHYPGFSIISVQRISSNQTNPIINITGEIESIQDGLTLTDHGILFINSNNSYEGDGLTLGEGHFESGLGTKNSTGPFTVTLDIQSGNLGEILDSTPIQYRAYATYDKNTVYSVEIFEFFYDSPLSISIDENDLITGVDRAQIPFSIENRAVDLVQYGICWSSEIEIPTIQDSITKNFGNPTEKESGLRSLLSNLEKGTKYYLRAYAIDNLSNVYYSNTSSFTTGLSGWQWGAQGINPIVANGLVSFSIDGKGYLGLGSTDGITGSEANLNFWQYNIETDSLTPIASFPGMGRVSAISFTINNKAYVGLGATVGTLMPLVDFWEYDPAMDSWTQVADFTGETRNVGDGFPSVFATQNNGYIGLGFDQNKELTSSFMKYNPMSNAWTPIASYPEVLALGVMSGSIDNLGIVGLGRNASGNLESFWSYDEPTDTWMAIESLVTRPDSYVGYKVVDRQFIFGAIISGGTPIPIHVEYDVLSDSWLTKAAPILLAAPLESSEFDISSSSLTLFSLNDRVVFIDYSIGETLEYFPDN